MTRDKTGRPALGRGLSALMADIQGEPGGRNGGVEGVREVDLSAISANPTQPRRTFHRESLEELSESIRANGVLQPIILRPLAAPDRFEIVAGERRWRAAGLAGLARIPALVRILDDAEALQVAIIENVQREDLDPIDEAVGYRRLIDQFGHAQEQVAGAVGKSRSHVANTLRLLTLPETVQGRVKTGALTAGHARALVTAEDPERLAAIVVDKGLTVRQTEALARGARPGTKAGTPPEKDADTRALEGDLSATLRMAVRILHEPGGGGALTVHYRTLEDLDVLCRALSGASRDG